MCVPVGGSVPEALKAKGEPIYHERRTSPPRATAD
jgi:hypothetical protein